jgi:hypothetical protein
MFIRNNIALSLLALVTGAVASPAKSAPPTYRQLSPQEIQKALAAPRTKGPRECEVTDPSMAQRVRLPAGFSLRQEGYYCDVIAGKVIYSFVQTSEPAGKEVLFACAWNPRLWPVPWYMWAGVPKACGFAAVEPQPIRARQLADWAKLNYWFMPDAVEPLQTREGKAYFNKLQPYFERVLRQCSKPVSEENRRYAWLGRISSKGRVVRTGVLITQSDDRHPETSPYMECMNEKMKAIELPAPPYVHRDMISDGGWPITFHWRRSGGVDELTSER